MTDWKSRALELSEELRKWARIAAAESPDGCSPEETLFWQAAYALLSEQRRAEEDHLAREAAERRAELYRARARRLQDKWRDLHGRYRSEQRRAEVLQAAHKEAEREAAAWQRRAEEAERVARLHAQNEVSAMGRACDERARAEAAESQLQRLRGALERDALIETIRENVSCERRYFPAGGEDPWEEYVGGVEEAADAIRSALSPTVGMGEEKQFAENANWSSVAESAAEEAGAVTLEALDFERAIAKLIEPKAFEPSNDLTGLEQNHRAILRKQAVQKAAGILQLISAREAAALNPPTEGETP